MQSSTIPENVLNMSKIGNNSGKSSLPKTCGHAKTIMSYNLTSW